MLRPLDRDRRDGPLYPGSDRTLRDLIEPNHLLLQIEQAIDLAALAADLEQVYDQRRGRPAIHPEVVVRALLLAALYQVPSYRQLCARISENLAWRYFCHLTLDDPVFDHSTLSVFLDRIGPGGVQQLVDTLNASFADAGLVSSQLYVDSSLMPAAVRTAVLSPREAGLPPPERAGGIFVAREQVRGSPQELDQLRLLRYQDRMGQLPLPVHDSDARWKTIRGPAVLGYKEHLIVDRSGFILARRATGADVMDVAGCCRCSITSRSSRTVSLRTPATGTSPFAGRCAAGGSRRRFPWRRDRSPSVQPALSIMAITWSVLRAPASCP